MDICMFLPYERKELLRLLQEYDAIRKKLIGFLEDIEKDWESELCNLLQLKHGDEFGAMAEERFSILNCWMRDLEEWEIPLEEMEGEDM